MKKPTINKHAILFLLAIFFSVNSNADIQKSTTTDISQDAFIEKKTNNTDVVIIDVRTPEEFALGHIPSAVNIPHTQILANTALLDKYSGKEKVFYCHSGVRVKSVTDLLESQNISGLYHLQGDYLEWRESNQSIEK